MLTFADLTRATGVPNKVLHDWKAYGLIQVVGNPYPGAGNGAHWCHDSELRVARALVAAGIRRRGDRQPARRRLLAAVADGVRRATPEAGRWLVVLHTERGPQTFQAGDAAVSAPHWCQRTLVPLWD